MNIKPNHRQPSLTSIVVFASQRYKKREATKAGLVLILPVVLCVHSSLPAFYEGLGMQKVLVETGRVLSLSRNALPRMIGN